MASMLARSRCSLARSAPVQRNARLVVRASSQKVEKTGKAELQSLVAPAVVTAVANAIMAMPAAADAGKLFDFNLTLPAMAGEFLLLMVFLDKTWFGPVGKVLDERDATIRNKLASVKGDSSELEAMIKEAAEVVKAARSEVSAMITKEKNAKTAELDKAYAAAKDKVNKEVEASIAAVQKESDALLKSLDAKVDGITSEVLARVLPAGVKI